MIGMSYDRFWPVWFLEQFSELIAFHRQTEYRLNLITLKHESKHSLQNRLYSCTNISFENELIQFTEFANYSDKNCKMCV